MNPWMNLTHDWLFRTTVEGSVLILTVLTLSHVLGGRLGPRWRVVLWTLVGLKLLVPAFMPAMPGLGNWFRQQAVESVVTLPAIPSEMIVAADATFPAAAASDEFPAESGEPWTVLLVAIWGIGAILFFLAIFWRQYRFEKRAGLQPCRDTRLLTQVREVARELGVCQDFRTVFGPAGGTPAVCGVTHARLVLPCDWEARFDAAALRLILMHELEHIRRHDVLQNWLAALVNAVHWFNPIVWIAVSRFQSDRELLCDARTLSRLGPAERFDYGRTLLRVQSEFLPAPAIAGVAPCVRNHPTLQQRIRMITNPVRKNAWLNALLVPGVAGIMAISFGSATADEKQPSREGDRPREGEREGDSPRGGEKEGERSRSAEREGDRPREGEREGDRPREGSREGERPRDGEREGERSREGGREGERPGPRPGEIAVFVVPDGARMGDRFIPNGKLRGELVHMKAQTAIVSAEPQVPFQQVNAVVDALRDSGIRDIRIGGPGRGPRPEGGPRDGGMPRPEGGPRDGGMPRPEGGPRDGDKPRPEGGPRDGDKPRPEGGPRDGDKPRPEGGPRDGDKPRPEGGPRDGDKPRPEGGPRDGDKPRPEGGPSRWRQTSFRRWPPRW
jgi:beta-lactamase regulating signal transducer with metallopeptidase domain